MKCLAFFDETGALARVGPDGNGGVPEAVVVSPLDLHTYLIELPRLRKDLAEGAARFRLRSLHPGNPENERADLRGNGPGGSSVIAFVAPMAVAEKYRSTGLPPVAPLLVLRSIAPRGGGKWIGVFCGPGWIEAALFDGETVLRNETVPVGAAQRECSWDSVASALGPLTEPVEQIAFVVPDPRSCFAARMAKEAGAAFPSGARIVDLRALPRRALSSCALFADPVAKRRVPGAALLAFLALDCCVALFSLHKAATIREAELRELKGSYASMKERYAADESALAELRELEARAASGGAAQAVDAYGTIAEIASCLGSGARVRNLVLRERTFSVEAEGTDPLSALSRFGASELFERTTLNKAELTTARDESFSITGTLRDDGE